MNVPLLALPPGVVTAMVPVLARRRPPAPIAASLPPPAIYPAFSNLSAAFLNFSAVMVLSFASDSL